MSDPTKYVLGYSFSGFQASNPAVPLPAQNVDNEFFGVQASISEAIDAIKSIRRSDGKLQSGLITKDSLPVELLTGLKPANPWATATAYSIDDVVTFDVKVYRCIVAHTSGTFEVDLAAAKWSLVMDFSSLAADTGGPATGISFSPSGSLTATDVQAAITQVDTLKAPLANASMTGTFTINGAVPWTNANFDPANKADAATVNGLLGSKADQAAVDQALAAKANLSSPAFTGNPRTPVPAVADNSDTIVNSNWVRQQGYATPSQLTSYAPKATAVTGMRIGSPAVSSGTRPAGHVLVDGGLVQDSFGNTVFSKSWRPLQVLVNGVWTTVSG